MRHIILQNSMLWVMVHLLIFAQLLSASGADFYVSPVGSDANPGTLESPFATIAHARDAVAQVNSGMTGDITVHLRGGTYALSSSLLFDENDSGQNGHKVIYKAFAGETPVVSGGQVITGWTMHDAGKNIYKASVAGLDFRQIYVNGVRGIRSRYPNRTNDVTLGGYLTGATMSSTRPHQLSVNATELAGWETWGNLNEVEVVMVTHWKQKRARIAGISGGTISFQSPENSTYAMYHLEQSGTPHWYENAYEFLDTQGEFYLNTNTDTLYYKPRAGEDMASIEVVVPVAETLFDIAGSSSAAKAHDLEFDGITFQYSNWTKPNTHGYTVMQSAAWYSNSVTYFDMNSPIPAAVQLRNANNVNIKSCTIKRTGAHAIAAVGDVVNNCSIIRNLVSDTSAGGIYLLLNDANSSGHAITDNTVEYIGMDYSDACGILVARTPNVSILHNEIRHLRYTGISTGWIWDDSDTTAINHEVGYNLIHHTMGLHDDGGGIYTLGKIPGMQIHDNYIHSISRSDYSGNYGICGVYLDNGSSFKTAHHNVIQDVVAGFFSGNPPNHDNVIEWNYYNGTFATTIAAGNTVQNNVQVSGTNWPVAALAIMEFAGPRETIENAKYWDDDPATAGFGTAGENTGTWAAPTAGPSAGWSLSGTGVNAFAPFTTATTDNLNFGNGSIGLGTGTITVSGTVDGGNMSFASGSGAIVLSGGTINLAEAQATTVNNATNTISSILTGAGTSFTKVGTGALILSNTNSYSGTTIITGGALVLDSANALPGGIGTSGGTSALTFVGGVIGLGDGDFARSLGTAGVVTAVNFTGAGGWAAYDADRLVNLGGGGAVTWATANTGFNAKTLILGAATATHKVTLQNDLDLGDAARTVQTDDGAAAVDGELSGIISGVGGGLIKTGAGTLILANNNSYTGTTIITGGALVLDSADALPGGIGTFGGTSALTFNGGVIGLGDGNFTRSLGTAGTATAANFTGAGGWAAYDADRLVNLGGASAAVTWATANTGFNAQTLILGASSATHKVTLQNGLDLGTAARTVQTDNGAAAVDGELSGILSGSGGGLNKTGTGTLVLSNSNTYTGTTNVNAGMLTLTGNRTVASGVVNVSGASTLNIQGDLPFSSASNNNFSVNGSTAVVNHSAGTVTLTQLQLLMGNSAGSNSTYNLSGTGVLTTAASTSRGITLGANPGASGNPVTTAFNMTGGTLNNNTGTLMLARSEFNADYFNSSYTQSAGIANHGTLTMGGNGGNGENSTATLTLTGGSFTATAFTYLSGGNNVTSTINIGGTAVVTLPNLPTTRGTSSTATLNFDGGTLKNSATGTFITGLTNAFIKAGGTKFDTSLNSTTISQNLLTHGSSFGGGLTKIGANTLTLSGANTYTGDTTVNTGTLVLADNAQLKFVIGATSGTNNRITGTGTLTLDGDFNIDTTLTDASALTSGSWTIVDAAMLNETFGTSFTITGAEWSEASNIWTKTVGSKKYTFIEATGLLTLNPTAPYASWSSGSEPFDGDANGDGVADGLAWFLGASGPGVNALNKLPVVATPTGFLTLDFDRVNNSSPAKLYVEYGNDLAGWTKAEIPVGSSTFGGDLEVVVTSGTPNQLLVKIPSTHAVNGKLFARLSATEN